MPGFTFSLAKDFLDMGDLTAEPGRATLNHMVKHYLTQMDRTFFALSDPTRRAIIGNLAAKGDLSVMELASPFGMSVPAVSKHLKLLEKANLIKRRKVGRIHYLQLSAEPMREVSQWLAAYGRFWQIKLDSLESYLSEIQKGEMPNEPNKHQGHNTGSKKANKRPRRKGI